eukprot:g3266.t1
MSHGRRPVFYSAEHQKYLYYHGKRGQWQIHHKIGNYASCRLKTKRAAHAVGWDANEVWGVWNQSKKSFVKEPDMGVCYMPPPTPEELLEAAPLLAYQAECLLRISSTPLGGGAPPDAAHVSSVSSLRRWKMCCRILEDLAPEEYYACSEESQSYSPAKATWKYKGKPRLWTTPKPEDFRAVPPGWKDESFEGLHMMGVWTDYTRQAEYVRALELSMFKSPDGKAHIFQTKEIAEDGKYEFKLFDYKSNEWTIVTIDDYLPCEPQNALLMYAKMPSGKMWPALLEKAIAKLMGSYHDMRGVPTTVFTIMTGCTEHIAHGLGNSPPLPEWQAMAEIAVVDEPGGQSLGCLGRLGQQMLTDLIVPFTKTNGEGPAEGWVPYYVKGQRVAKRITEILWHVNPWGREEEKESNVTDDTMWQKILQLDSGRDERTEDGLTESHAYSVLHAKEACGHRLICLRNPWGHWEWKGPWNDAWYADGGETSARRPTSRPRPVQIGRGRWVILGRLLQDKGEEWRQNPGVAKALQVDMKEDGVFWTDYEDFKWNFSIIFQTKIAMPTKRRGQDWAVHSGAMADPANRPTLLEESGKRQHKVMNGHVYPLVAQERRRRSPTSPPSIPSSSSSMSKQLGSFRERQEALLAKQGRLNATAASRHAVPMEEAETDDLRSAAGSVASKAPSLHPSVASSMGLSEVTLGAGDDTAYWDFQHRKVEKKDLGHKCFECKETFKSPGDTETTRHILGLGGALTERRGGRVSMRYHGECFSGFADPRSQARSSHHEGRLAGSQLQAAPQEKKGEEKGRSVLQEVTTKMRTAKHFEQGGRVASSIGGKFGTMMAMGHNSFGSKSSKGKVHLPQRAPGDLT